MKKMLKLLIALLILYLIMQQVFYFFSKGHKVEYSIKSNDKVVYIKEVLSAKKEVTDGYYIELKFDDYTIPFKIYKKYSKKKRIINSVDLLYGDTFVCAKINIKNKSNETDIKCSRNGIAYYYSNIKGIDSKLDQLVAATTYDSSKYINDEFVVNKDNIEYYPNNFIENQNILISLYKGPYLFGKGVTNGARFVQLFDKDHYTKPLEAYVDGYYIVANYNDNHEFLTFYSVNLSTGAKDDITNSEYISYSSYIQGVQDGKLYVIDIDSKKQYAIDPKRKNIEMIGNSNTGAQIYTKDGWVTKNMVEVINSRTGFYSTTSNTFNGVNYAKVDQLGSNVYYLYKSNGNAYEAYIVYKEDENYTKNYIFSTTDINRISYVGGNVYYLYGDEIRVFSIDGGIKKIVKYNELRYNTSLNFFAN